MPAFICIDLLISRVLKINDDDDDDDLNTPMVTRYAYLGLINSFQKRSVKSRCVQKQFSARAVPGPK